MMQNGDKKGNKMRLMLMILAGGAFLTAELLDEFFNYNKSYKKARSRLLGAYNYPHKFEYTNTDTQRFYSLLNELKRQGLVSKTAHDNGNSLWKITSAGFHKLKLIRERKTDYEPIKDNKFKIIIFDIPEKLKRKRAWLREALSALEFKMLQKSVWIGKNKIPEDFLEDLRSNRLMPFVHILEITKTGTIKETI